MVWTQKESGLLTDLQKQEQTCIDKYNRYASQACDPTLKDLFTRFAQNEQTHLNTVNTMMGGSIPQIGGQGGSASSRFSHVLTAACQSFIGSRPTFQPLEA